ncbi:hypothetical protein [Rodentibacter trehalosifermentans]|uniref:Uncharacterized protein n=1 Tax=Rodentibacter trehalosifermentans TaxID=1908263 RepID=A0A1V3ISJ2_9PAST|nr:hypothetical protein [Rodentibacter trehalosifermentans]OOF45076.1 hypothetical protein BKK51_07550 [Rodentibacter trehalosifermentans]OOF52334.1 hypothetical protein BKK53_05730 [Rodentibacter trehalosifermentans]
MANKYRKHLFILCEDDINKEISKGITEQLDLNPTNIIHYEKIARGWEKCFSLLEHKYIPELLDIPERYLLIVMDFDGQFDERMNKFKLILDNSSELSERVFLVGAAAEPETLKANLKLSGHNDDVGRQLFDDCNAESSQYWCSSELVHNKDEIERLKKTTSSFINWNKSS